VEPAEVLLSSVKQRFHASIPTIDARMYEAVTNAGFFARNPATTRRIWYSVSIASIVLGVALASGGSIWLIGIVPIIFLPGLALAFIGTVLALIAGGMPRRTPQGALEAARWRAFRTYLAEAVRVERSAAPLPPHYLPYAVAFGSATGFVRHLEQVGAPPPPWYGRYSSPGGIVFVPGGWYGGVWGGGHVGRNGHPQGSTAGGSPTAVATPPVPAPQGWSDALAALLNAASEAMAHGGGAGGWSGGGFGGGGGGGGGSGGFR
jgi:uncharacterized membrane protein YgcG